MHAALERLTVSLRFTVIPGDRGFESIPEMACRHSSDIVVGDVQTIRVEKNRDTSLGQEVVGNTGGLGKGASPIC